jgi:hypothetical protein
MDGQMHNYEKFSVSCKLSMFYTLDFGEGLEGIAEDGTPMTLAESVKAKEGISMAEVFSTIFPGLKQNGLSLGNDCLNLLLVSRTTSINETTKKNHIWDTPGQRFSLSLKWLIKRRFYGTVYLIQF